jgi:hypothetical protein
MCMGLFNVFFDLGPEQMFTLANDKVWNATMRTEIAKGRMLLEGWYKQYTVT